MSRLEHVDVVDLHPAGDNPRRHVDVDAELVATIKSLGVLEPLVVSKSTTNGYTVVAGHRRLAAAKAAGLVHVPCVVHEDLTDRERAEMMLVENLQRENLSPIEEAGAYRRLTELGHSQRELARIVGRKQPHISKRLALLKLPPQAQAAVDLGADAGGITLEQAQQLAKLPAEKIAELLKGERVPKEWEIEQAVRAHERDQERRRVLAELTKQGTAVVDQPPGPAWKHRLAAADNGYGLAVDVPAHAGEPCHVALIEPAGKVSLWCTSPERHQPDGDSTVKVQSREEEPTPDRPTSLRESRAAAREKPLTADQEATLRRRAEAHEASERRREFALQLVADAEAGRGQVGGYMAFTACAIALGGEPHTGAACELLGVDPGANVWDPKPLVEWINEPTGGPPYRAVTALYAMALASSLQFTGVGEPQRWHADRPFEPWGEDEILEARLLLDHLQSRGYEWSPVERWQLGLDEEPDEGDVVAGHGFEVVPVGRAKPPKKVKLVCDCGFEALQTTEELARERHAAHVAEAGEGAGGPS